MSRSNRLAARSRLFSLSARLERRAARRSPTVDDHGEDDGCLICLAMRDPSFSPAELIPRADGSPPRFPEAVLIEAARRAIAASAPVPDQDVVFSQYQTLLPDGSFGDAFFSVDAEGRVFWSSSTHRVQIAQLPESVCSSEARTVA